LAIVMGGVAAYMARVWIAAQMPTAAATNGKIVVAAAPLTFGTVLSRENTAEIPWPADAVPEGAFTTKNELLKDGRRAALMPLQRNELIIKSKITGPGQRATLSSLLDEGQRAVTVRVDDVRGVAGFVLPGDRVDVVLIRSGPSANGGSESFSDVSLQHATVPAPPPLVHQPH